MFAERISVVPIGTVHHGGGEVYVEVDRSYADALDGLKSGQKIQVLYWMHQLGQKDRKALKIYPMGDRSRGKRGVFALRSPMRPNPIGSTVVELVRRRGNKLTVKGLDAYEGSPVIDMKWAPDS